MEPAHGYVIMQKVEELSQGNVRIAAGTLYGAIENLLKLGFIYPVPSQDTRRKVYTISPSGKRILLLDFCRMKQMIKVSEKFFHGDMVHENTVHGKVALHGEEEEAQYE